MYGKITENSIRISKEKIEGYKPIVDERPLQGGGVFKEYVERDECIAKVYTEKENDDTKERLDTLESAVMELAELVSKDEEEGSEDNGEVVS